MKFTKKTLFFIFCIYACAGLVTGCDQGGAGDETVSPTPEPPTPTPPEPPNPEPPTPDPDPAVVLPEATTVSIRQLYTTEHLSGSYNYSDASERPEGKSEKSWVDATTLEVISYEAQPGVAALSPHTKIKYCVKPYTFDGVSGDESCSTPLDISQNSKEVADSTDWNTDTDYINDSAHGDVRGGPAGNIHFYYGINLQPISTDESHLGKISIGATSPIERKFYASFNLDNVYAMLSPEGKISLVNDTPRTLAEPVIRINNDYYYQAKSFTLEPFTRTDVSINSNQPVSSAVLVDNHPGYKLNVAGFWQGDQSRATATGEKPPVNLFEKILHQEGNHRIPEHSDILSSLLSPASLQESVYGPVNEFQAKEFTRAMLFMKLLMNRFDVIKLFFDSQNNYQSLTGLPLSYPFDDILSYACESTLLAPEDKGANSCGANNVVAPMSYRVTALKKMVSHEANTEFRMLMADVAGVVGRSDMAPLLNPGMLAAAFFNKDNNSIPLDSLDTVMHEGIHRLGYSDGSGVVYGWVSGGPLESFLPHMDFYHPTPSGDADLTQSVVESSDYFSDYHWVNNRTVDVHFYTKGSAQPLRNVAVLADDEESGRSFPNFFGDWQTCTSDDWDDISDCPTWVQPDWDGSLQLGAGVQMINNHTLRITLTQPMTNYTKTLMVFASSADTNDEAGIWKTNYKQATADSVALQIVYDQPIQDEVPSLGIAYLTEMDDPAVLHDGSTGHLGKNGEDAVSAPNYYLSGDLYRTYSVEEATQQCLDHGYSGLGVVPYAEVSTQETQSPLADQINQYVYYGVLTGLDHDDHKTPVIIKAGLYWGHPITTDGNVNTDRANLIICALPQG